MDALHSSAPTICAALLAGLAPAAAPAADPPGHDRIALENRYFSEGASFGDIDGDGNGDAVSGPHIWFGPDFEHRIAYAEPQEVDPDKPGYVQEHFFSFVHDIDGDEQGDILTIGLPGTPVWWYRNPGGLENAEDPPPWERHQVVSGLGNESPTLADVLGDDGKPELWGIVDGRYGFATPKPDAPQEPWTFHPISEQTDFHKYSHGMGLGDISGDEKTDVVTKDGWFQQPEAGPASGTWPFHAFNFRPKRLSPMPGGAQIYVDDVDGDGDADVVTSLAAHAYGLAWFEQAPGPDDGPVFVEHTILPEKPSEASDAPNFSQLHAVAYADIDGDGQADILTGKCRYAHGPEGDPDPKGAPVVYAFLHRKGSEGGVTFEPLKIDDASGVGRQVSVSDINGDGTPDFIIGNKLGTFVFRSR